MDEERHILICVKTYPEYSAKYTETVCTAGILKDTRQLIRLYPIIYRYLEGDKRFGKYQWITAKIEKNPSDRRPESFKVELDSIRLGARITASDNWKERKRWVLNQKHIFPSLEALLEAQEAQGTSLGLIRVKKMINFEIVRKSNIEIKEAESKKDMIMKQLHFFEAKKNLELIPFRFTLRFLCNDLKCKSPHNVSILDWEFGELYRRVKTNQDWKNFIRRKVDQLLSPGRDTYLFMGNMSGHPTSFSVLGFFWPKRELQGRLF